MSNADLRVPSKGKSARSWEAQVQSEDRDGFFRRILDELPAAIYTTDPLGRITYYNEAAVELWGHRPPLGESEWSGSWHLFNSDGTPLAHADCPMAMAIKEQRPIRGVEAIAERPDGSRVPFLPFPTPLFDAKGRLVGAVNTLIDISSAKDADAVRERLAAIVTSSDDAIVSKNLSGIIQSWNAAAERMFGYTAEEAIGQSVLLIIPEDRQDEEPEILARLARGERIDHYETVRRRKDGTLLDVSLTVSPVRDATGRVIGASKIARDISESKRAAERQALLLREMNHRVKNLFTLASGIVGLSARSASSPQELASSVRERMAALGRAHDLTLPKLTDEEAVRQPSTTLHRLIETILAPFDRGEIDGHSRFEITGADFALSPQAVTSFALLIHEFATNAAKYGALSQPEGRVTVACAAEEDQLQLTWIERGGPTLVGAPTTEGFGGQLSRMILGGKFKGELTHDWSPEGLTVVIRAPRRSLDT